MKKILLLVILVVPNLVFSATLTKQDIMKCTYLAGIAREVQDIRIKTGDNFVTFKGNLDKIYKKDKGYEVIYSIAYKVYNEVPLEAKPSLVFGSLFDHCIQIRRTKVEYGL